MAKKNLIARVLYCKGPNEGPLPMREGLRLEIWDAKEKGWDLIKFVPFVQAAEHTANFDFIHFSILKEVVHLADLGYSISWETKKDN